MAPSLFGPFDLTIGSVDEHAPAAGPGTYLLGQVTQEGFLVQYVGRSDDNLNAKLKTHAGAGRYRSFQHAYAQFASEAFLRECALYHELGGTQLDNVMHPAPPSGAHMQCPYCGPQMAMRPLIDRHGRRFGQRDQIGGFHG